MASSGSIKNRYDCRCCGTSWLCSHSRSQLKKARGPAATQIKKRALQTLQRKRMYEQQRDQLAGQAFNVEQTAFAIDSIKDTQDTMAAMKAAHVTMKKEAKKLNIDEIEVGLSLVLERYAPLRRTRQ